MPPRIVVFGATGYTGRLTAERLVAQGERPVLAGRSEERLAALAERLGGLEHRVADVGEPATVRALIEPGDVLLTTVGPFKRWGGPAVDAAIDAGAVYLDSTGEPAFIRRVFQAHDAPARRAGATLLPAMGYDFVPGALAGALALEDAGTDAVRLDVGYFALGGGPAALSRGTRASLVGVSFDPAFAFRAGRVTRARSAERIRAFAVRGKDRPAVSVGGAEHFTLPAAYPRLREVDVYLGWFGRLARSTRVGLARGRAGQRSCPGRAALLQAAGRSSPGSAPHPRPGTTPGMTSYIVAVAYDAAGEQLGEVHLSGADAYAFTAGCLAWAARRAAAGGVLVAGAAGPLEAFGSTRSSGAAPRRGCRA